MYESGWVGEYVVYIVVGIHSTDRFGVPALGCHFLSADVISYRKGGLSRSLVVGRDLIAASIHLRVEQKTTTALTLFLFMSVSS